MQLPYHIVISQLTSVVCVRIMSGHLRTGPVTVVMHDFAGKDVLAAMATRSVCENGLNNNINAL